MKYRITRHASAADVELLPGGVLIVSVSGPLVAEALRHFRDKITTGHAGLAAFAVDFRRSAVAMGGHELDDMLAGDVAAGPAGLPAALVVRPAVAPLFLGHAARMIGRGITRQVFHELPAAVAWARSTATRSGWARRSRGTA